ncbi:uncharacterized protein LAESUDRAFT_760994, partial [Laetiporus sulphureus 93-53]
MPLRGWHPSYPPPPTGPPATLPGAPVHPEIQTSVTFFHQYQLFAAEFQKNTPLGIPIPSIQQFAEFQGMLSGHIPHQQPLAAPAVPAIQPHLDMQADIAQLRRELQEMKDKAGRQHEENEGTDSESDAPVTKHRRKTCKSVTAKRILSLEKGNLSKRQAEVREELQEAVIGHLKTLTGLRRNPFPLQGDVNDENDDVDGSAQDKPSMEFNFDETVTYEENAAIIRHIADLVYKEQTNDVSRTITHPDVNFTKRDLEEFAKTRFRTWKRAYQAQKDELKKAAQLANQARNRRRRRQEQLKQLRGTAVKAYQKRFKVDPSPVLLTDWMSEACSDWSDEEEARDVHRQLLATKAGLTQEEIEEGVKVLERRSLAWRSGQLCSVLAKLDQIVQTKRKGQGNAPIKMKRVDLQRPCTGVPPSKIYPFAISMAWVKEHPELMDE